MLSKVLSTVPSKIFIQGLNRHFCISSNNNAKLKKHFTVNALLLSTVIFSDIGEKFFLVMLIFFQSVC